MKAGLESSPPKMHFNFPPVIVKHACGHDVGPPCKAATMEQKYICFLDLQVIFNWHLAWLTGSFYPEAEVGMKIDGFLFQTNFINCFDYPG